MALPFAFASVASLVTTQLDSDFNALGALTPIPCAVSGTNALALTPLANTPTVAAFANYMQFSGVAASTNTGAMTAQVAGVVGALNVYVDRIAGPVACPAGVLVAGNAFTLLYDSTLNSGAGGFHLYTGTEGVNSTASVAVLDAATVSIGASAAPLTRWLSGTATLGTLGIAANGSTDSSFTFAAISGALVQDTILVAPSATINQGVVLSGFVSAAGTVVMRAANVTGTSVTLVANNYRLSAIGNT